MLGWTLSRLSDRSLRVKIIIIAACILAAGCTASRTGVLPASSPASQTAPTTPAAAPLAASAAAEIRVAGQVDLSTSARAEESMVCVREAPVGSRIPITRCYPANPAETAESIAVAEQQRQDLEEARRQRQLLLEQQRMQSARGGP